MTHKIVIDFEEWTDEEYRMIERAFARVAKEKGLDYDALVQNCNNLTWTPEFVADIEVPDDHI